MYEKRKAAFEEWLIDTTGMDPDCFSLDKDGQYDCIEYHAFVAGWKCRKNAEYERAYGIKKLFP